MRGYLSVVPPELYTYWVDMQIGLKGKVENVAVTKFEKIWDKSFTHYND